MPRNCRTRCCEICYKIKCRMGKCREVFILGGMQLNIARLLRLASGYMRKLNVPAA